MTSTSEYDDNKDITFCYYYIMPKLFIIVCKKCDRTFTTDNEFEDKCYECKTTTIWTKMKKFFWNIIKFCPTFYLRKKRP